MTHPTPLQAMKEVLVPILVDYYYKTDVELDESSLDEFHDKSVVTKSAFIFGEVIMGKIDLVVTKLLEGVAVELEAHREYAGGDKADYWLGLQSGLNDAISIIRNTLQK